MGSDKGRPVRTSVRIRADAQRMDWIESKGATVTPMLRAWEVTWRVGGEGWTACRSTGRTLREAIDTARGYTATLDYDGRVAKQQRESDAR